MQNKLKNDYQIDPRFSITVVKFCSILINCVNARPDFYIIVQIKKCALRK